MSSRWLALAQRWQMRADDLIPGNLVETVQEELARFTRTTGLVCRSDLAELAYVPLQMCEPVLRTISEGLTNIAHHAQATQIEIRALRKAEVLAIEIEDDGIGFDPASETTRAGHYGLLGLRERARLIGGEFVLDSAPGKGTTLSLRVPICQEEFYERETTNHSRVNRRRSSDGAHRPAYDVAHGRGH